MIFEDVPPFRKLADRSLWIIKQLQEGVEWPEECVAWPWATEERRHTMNFRGKAMPVTHVVLTFTEGERPSKDHQGLHTCPGGDHKWCINATHLRWGTELENRIDQVERKVGSIGKIGLNEAKIITEKFTAMVEGLAAEYEVTPDAIWGVATGRSWNRKQWETPK